MLTSKYSAKKRMMFIQKEDYNFLAYNLLIFLNTLGCTDEGKKFRDFRKVAYLIDFINTRRQFEEFTQHELANIYTKAHLKKQLISHLLVMLRNKGYIESFIASSNYFVDEQNNLHIKTIYKSTVSEERISFLSTHVRSRFSTIRNLENNSVIQTSHTSEIRNLASLKD